MPGAARRGVRPTSVQPVSDAPEDAAAPDEIGAGTDLRAVADSADLGEPDEADFGGWPADEAVSDPISTARRRHGTAGAVLAAGLFGIDVALGRKPREEAPVVVASPTEPSDIDSDGIRLDVDEQTTVVAPALPRSEPPSGRRRGRRARRTN